MKRILLGLELKRRTVVAGQRILVTGHIRPWYRGFFARRWFSFSTDGGVIVGKHGDQRVWIDTAGLQPGRYAVRGCAYYSYSGRHAHMAFAVDEFWVVPAYIETEGARPPVPPRPFLTPSFA